MSNIGERIEDSIRLTDRRSHARQQVRSLAYIDLGEDNGGIVLNISEGGMAVQAVVVMENEPLPRMRLLLPQSQSRLQTAGQIAWLSESRKEAGVQFVDLSEEARSQIREWITCEATGREYHPVEFAVRKEEIPVAIGPENREPVIVVVEPAMQSVAVEEKPPDPIPAPIAAVPRVVDTAPRVAVTPAPGVRIPRLLGDSEFKLLERAAERRVRGFAPRPRMWVLATVLGLLAVLSFYVGLATGRGNLNQLLANMGWKPTDTTNLANGATTSDSGAADAPTPPVDQNVHAQPGGNSPLQSAGKETSSAPPSLSLHRPKTSAAKDAAANDNSTVLLNLPETPLSASASVAISTRRSIPVPPDAGTQTTPQGESLHIGELISRVDPVYPPEAVRQGVEGVVQLHAALNADGTIASVEKLSGPDLLATAAIEAVRGWRYKPTLFNGKPIGTEEDIKLVFRLPH